MLRNNTLKHIESGINISVAHADFLRARRSRKLKLKHIVPGMRLSVYEAERYCAFDLSNNPIDVQTKKQVADWLARYYKRGGKRASADQWKAKTYEIIANPSSTKEEESEAIAAMNGWNFKRTQSWYAVFGWFTSIRLFLARTNRVADLAGKPIINKLIISIFELFTSSSNSVLTIIKTRFLAIGGFSYALELLLDIGVLLKHIFKPDEGKKHLPWYKRLHTALCKDNRWYRMLNAAVWLSVNVATFIITGGLSSILNICGFSFDPINELILSLPELQKNKVLLQKFNKRLSKLEHKIDSHAPIEFAKYKRRASRNEYLESRLKSVLDNLKIEKNPETLRKLNAEKNLIQAKLKITAHELNKLETIIQEKVPQNIFQEYKKSHREIRKQEETIKVLKSNRFYAVCIVLGVLLGTALFLFPPTGIPAIAGAIIALAAGSILGGLGRRLYLRKGEIANFFSNLGSNIKNYFCPKKPSVTQPPQPNPAPALTTSRSQARLFKSSSLADLRAPLLSEPRSANDEKNLIAESPQQDSPEAYSPPIFTNSTKTSALFQSLLDLPLNEKEEKTLFAGSGAPNAYSPPAPRYERKTKISPLLQLSIHNNSAELTTTITPASLAAPAAGK
jgi:hypothetical protein